MKIRTVTAFVTLPKPSHSGIGDDGDSVHCPVVRATCNKLRGVCNRLEEAGYIIQTKRIATNSWTEWTADNAIATIGKVKETAENAGINFFSIGPVSTVKETEAIPGIAEAVGPVAMSVALPPPAVPAPITSETREEDVGNSDAYRLAYAAAESVLKVARESGDGLGCFHVTVSANVQPFCPFFPVSHAGSAKDGGLEMNGDHPNCGFAIGLENSRVLHLVTNKLQKLVPSGDFQPSQYSKLLNEHMTEFLLPLQEVCVEAGKEHDIDFMGCDASINPSLDSEESIATAFVKAGAGPTFGASGTLALAQATTQALKDLVDQGIRLTGYSGLMLPVLEDTGIAEAGNGGHVTISSLLMLSSVCGIGLDTVPVSGDVPPERLARLFLDMAAMAHRLDKPLSCRVLPCPGLVAGEMTNFDFPYVINAKIFNL
eukprot:Clim_evm35s153 gene=Clim_evmTU35s153